MTVRDAEETAWVIDVGDATFESAVIERSRHTPVVVDFWAPWCGPCRALGPLLERLAAEHAGAFVLARVNVDEAPGLSAALRIGSIPMVLGFRDGAAVAEFVGAQPEAEVRAFLERVLPSAADRLVADGERLVRDGRPGDAEGVFRRALELDGRCERALLGVAKIVADRGDDGEAMALLERIAPGSVRTEADRLAAAIRVREGAGGDERSLRAKLAADPSDLASRLLLAQALAAASRHAEALDQYLEIVRRDRGFRDEAARKAMLDIFALLGPQHDVTAHYRSELAKVLFS
ncbi:MAG: tetratricopeptide repeat protein [Candidatus Binatia bacterium]